MQLITLEKLYRQATPALTSWAIVQALMDVNVAVETKTMIAIWAGDMGSVFVSCTDNARKV